MLNHTFKRLQQALREYSQRTCGHGRILIVPSAVTMPFFLANIWPIAFWRLRLRNTLATHLCSMLCLFVTMSARADIVPDLYSAQVPVAGQNSSALVRGSRAALADVLVKVSGSFDLLKDPAIKAALKDARSHVQQYAYSRDRQGDGGLSARFEFDSAFVSGLVRQAGAPLWTANRPLVLAWVVVEDEAGRRFLSRDAMPEQAAVVLAEFSRRGVPVQIPLFDLADTAAVSPEDAWRLDTLVLQAASQRYKVEDIVVARLSTRTAGKLTGDWKYIHLDDQLRQHIQARCSN